MHGAVFTIDARNLFVQVQRNALLCIPLDIVQHNVFNGLLAG